MPAKKWDKDIVTAEFLKLVEAGESLAPKNLRKHHNALYIQIGRKFDNYKSFLESLGYVYEDVTGFRNWSKEAIALELASRQSTGKSLKRQDIEKDDYALLSAMAKYYGSFKSAMLSCGFEYESNLGFQFWDRDKIKREFLTFYGDENVRTIDTIRSINRGLDHAIRKFFGTYDVLCDEMGLDVNKVRAEVYEWKADDLLTVLRDMRAEGIPLNVMSVQNRFPSAVKVAVRYFGSYENALREIGERYEDHVDDRMLTSFLGHEFERTLHEMFTLLGRNYVHHFRGFPGIVPDFYDEEAREILDGKLSSWSVFNCDTIQKYSPYCDNLTIIYLRGEHVSHNYNKLRLRHVSSYYQELREKGYQHIVDKFTELENKLLKSAPNDGAIFVCA